jgi:hypothetical protein
MRAWMINYRYPTDPVTYSRVVHAKDREGALRAFHSCGAHSDNVISVERYSVEKPKKLEVTIELPSSLTTAMGQPIDLDLMGHFLNYVAGMLRLRLHTLDTAEHELRQLVAGQGMYVYRGGSHLAVHFYSGHPDRLLFVTEEG